MEGPYAGTQLDLGSVDRDKQSIAIAGHAQVLLLKRQNN